MEGRSKSSRHTTKMALHFFVSFLGVSNVTQQLNWLSLKFIKRHLVQMVNAGSGSFDRISNNILTNRCINCTRALRISFIRSAVAVVPFCESHCSSRSIYPLRMHAFFTNHSPSPRSIEPACLRIRQETVDVAYDQKSLLNWYFYEWWSKFFFIIRFKELMKMSKYITG